MLILGIESSCDETAASVLQDGTHIRSSVVASQAATHHAFGGVVPELASREHVDNIARVVDMALQQAGCGFSDLEGVAVTRGPGLMGALLVGLSYAKGLAYRLQIPFLGVNHLEGHLLSIFLDNAKAELPALSLVVSGGHTNLYLVTKKLDYRLLSRSRDDAAGEALDKLSKMLDLGYPGGPMIERLASHGNSEAVAFTMPKISDGSLDFSFSGLKSAARRLLQEHPGPKLDPEDLGAAPSRIADLAASFQKAVVDQLLLRSRQALEPQDVRSFHLSGGVSCNRYLRARAADEFANLGLPVYFPHPSLTTDNAAMIAAAGYTRLQAGDRDAWDLPADPSLQVQESSQ